MLAQLNDEGRSRESRAIEQDSNVFAIIEGQDGQHYLNLKYTRSCPSTRIPLTFRNEFTRFESYDQGSRPRVGCSCGPSSSNKIQPDCPTRS